MVHSWHWAWNPVVIWLMKMTKAMAMSLAIATSVTRSSATAEGLGNSTLRNHNIQTRNLTKDGAKKKDFVLACSCLHIAAPMHTFPDVRFLARTHVIRTTHWTWMSTLTDNAVLLGKLRNVGRIVACIRSMAFPMLKSLGSGLCSRILGQCTIYNVWQSGLGGLTRCVQGQSAVYN